MQIWNEIVFREYKPTLALFYKYIYQFEFFPVQMQLERPIFLFILSNCKN